MRLHHLVDLLLALVLLKMQDADAAVRAKVVAVLNHVNKAFRAIM